MRKRIYIAGPMRGIPKYNFPNFILAKARLSADWDVVSPVDLDATVGFDAMSLPDNTEWFEVPPGFDLNAAVKRDLDALQTCDAIYLLDFWWNSTGAKAELAVARWLGLQILQEIVCPEGKDNG